MGDPLPNSISAIVVVDEQSSIDLLEQTSESISAECPDSELIVVANRVSAQQIVELRRTVSRIPDATLLVLTDRVDQATAQLIGIETAIHDWIVLLTPTRAELQMLWMLLENAAQGNDIVGLGYNLPKSRGIWQRTADRITNWLYRTIAGIAKPSSVPAVLLISREAGLYISSHYQGEVLLRSPEAIRGFSAHIIGDKHCNGPVPAAAQKRTSLRRHLKYLFLSTKAPIRAASITGMLGSLFCLSYSLYTVLIYLLRTDVAPGWTTLSMVISVGLFLMFVVMSILAEFVFQILADTVPRRRFAVRREIRSTHTRRSARLNVFQSGEPSFRLGTPAAAQWKASA